MEPKRDYGIAKDIGLVRLACWLVSWLVGDCRGMFSFLLQIRVFVSFQTDGFGFGFVRAKVSVG